MPTPSEFEEKEFEIPLYMELVSERRLWAPGQVLEGHLGFDAALHVTNDFWAIAGRTSAPGVTLARYGLSPMLAQPGTLPDFSTNVFLQVKRPYEYTNPPADVKAHGFSAPSWFFRVTAHQQVFLERLAEHLGSNADVSYACPAFSTKKKLFERTTGGELRKHTTFPTAVRLHDHERWIYATGGGVGLAKSDPEHVDVGDLAERVEELRREPDQRWSSRATTSEDDPKGETTNPDREQHLGRQLQVVWDAINASLEAEGPRPGVTQPIRDALRQVDPDHKPYRRLATSIAVVMGLLGIAWLVPATTDEPS